MTDENRNRGTWGGSSTAVDRQDRDVRGHSLLGNLLTLLFTGVIIAGGFLLPTLLYPYLDPYRNDMVQLAHSSESALSEHIFEEPVTLYPWNLYEEDRLRSLSSAERELLEARGVPSFIAATLRDHGLQMDLDESSYHTQIINSFRYLEPRDEIEPGCFVLVDADIDADGQADLRCAADPTGNIISLLLVQEQWDSVQIEAPIGVAIAPPESDGTPEESMTEAQDTENPTEETGEGEGTATEPEDTQGEGVDTRDTETGLGPEDTQNETDVTTGAAQTIEYMPVEEDRYLWAFSYVASREAKAINQQELFSAFRQLE
ncbi:MAG: hypothetical protein LBK67_08325, partial [Coriobacteriales bacterium]|nr:hypothetical protein [Coriobacteriales bacterium]